MKLTNEEILKKLTFYKDYIENLHNENIRLEDELSTKNKELDDKEFDLSEMKKDIDEMSSLCAERLGTIAGLENKLKSLEEKTSKTIKHLVEDVIEKQEKTIEEKDEEIKNLKKRLREKAHTDKPVDAEKPSKEVKETIKEEKQEEERKHLVQFEQDKDPTLHYKFGDAKQSFGETFKAFVKDCCPTEPGKFLVEPRIESLKLNISPKTEVAFLGHLEAIELDKKPLIEEIGGSWYTNFTQSEILSNTF